MRLPEDNGTKQPVYFKLLKRRRVQAGVLWLALVHRISIRDACHLCRNSVRNRAFTLRI